MQQQQRCYQSAEYRFGYQGQEKVSEIKGEANSLNFKYRLYDSRLGRFFSVDPLFRKYPYYSTYSFSGNRVIDAIEIEGLEPGVLFSTLDAAAENFGKLFNDNSIRINKEIGTYFYETYDANSNLVYSYSIPFFGTLNTVTMTSTDMDNLSKQGNNVIAYGHTHGASSVNAPSGLRHRDNEFSGVGSSPIDGDVEVSTKLNIDGYVVTPNGSLIKYILKSNTPVTLSTNMPSDAGNGSGSVGAGISPPTTTSYVVEPGDTYAIIAKKMMTTESAIFIENNVKNQNANPKSGSTLQITN